MRDHAIDSLFATYTSHPTFSGITEGLVQVLPRSFKALVWVVHRSSNGPLHHLQRSSTGPVEVLQWSFTHPSKVLQWSFKGPTQLLYRSSIRVFNGLLFTSPVQVYSWASTGRRVCCTANTLQVNRGGQQTECNCVKGTAQRSETSGKAVLMVIQVLVTKFNPTTCDPTQSSLQFEW